MAIFIYWYIKRQNSKTEILILESFSCHREIIGLGFT